MRQAFREYCAGPESLNGFRYPIITKAVLAALEKNNFGSWDDANGLLLGHLLNCQAALRIQRSHQYLGRLRVKLDSHSTGATRMGSHDWDAFGFKEAASEADVLVTDVPILGLRMHNSPTAEEFSFQPPSVAALTHNLID
jgi:hypothetical protein